MNNRNEPGSSKSALILIGIIIILLYMYSNASRSNEEARQKFAYLTTSAENQNYISTSATKAVEDKIKGCIDIHQASRYLGTQQCVVGRIAYIEENIKVDDYEPTIYYTYFDYMPNTFFLIGDLSFYGYIGSCVVVFGKIESDPNGAPVMIAIDSMEFDNEFSIEALPDDLCIPAQLR